MPGGGAGECDERGDHERRRPGAANLRRITFVAALGGFLFGYDTGVISALLHITPDFNLGSFGPQAVVASLLLGAVFGALTGGWTS